MGSNALTLVGYAQVVGLDLVNIQPPRSVTHSLRFSHSSMRLPSWVL